jgi:hypothetical protein
MLCSTAIVTRSCTTYRLCRDPVILFWTVCGHEGCGMGSLKDNASRGIEGNRGVEPHVRIVDDWAKFEPASPKIWSAAFASIPVPQAILFCSTYYTWRHSESTKRLDPHSTYMNKIFWTRNALELVPKMWRSNFEHLYHEQTHNKAGFMLERAVCETAIVRDT